MLPPAGLPLWGTAGVTLIGSSEYGKKANISIELKRQEKSNGKTEYGKKIRAG
jgi:hypothetical protein